MSVDLGAILRQRNAARRYRPRTRERATPGVQARRVDEFRYRRDLRRIVAELAEQTQRALFPLLESLESQYLRDDYVDPLTSGLQAIRLQYAQLDAIAAAMATRHISEVDQAHRKRFYRQLERATKVDLEGIVSNEGLAPLLKARTAENVGLIKSIPEEYFGKLERLVYESTIEGNTPAGGIKRQIQELWDVTERRANFIARDQVAKLNADLTERRNRDIGIEEYIWSTSLDERVRDSHRRKEGNRYRWDSPPKDTGHPGKDYNCRCVARSVIPTELLEAA